MSFEQEQFEEELKAQTRDVEIPDSLKPENIEKLLEQKEVKKKKWKPLYTVCAAAACCIFVIGIAAAGHGRLTQNGETIEKTPDSAEQASAADSGESKSKVSEDKVIASAEDYDQIYKYIKAERKNKESQTEAYAYNGARQESKADGGAAEDSASMAGAAGQNAASADQASAYSDTNVRQEGVGEGDIVKTDGRHLYILNGQKIQIVDIENKEMEELASIRMEDDCYVSELYVKDDKLIIVYTRSEYEDGETGYGGIYKQYTVAETYDVSRPEKPESIGTVTQSGDFYTMRVIGDYVYLFSNFYADVQAARDDISSYIPEINGKAVDSANILLPQYIRGSQYTVVSSFSLKDPEKKADSKAIFGSAGLVYVSNENIYVCEGYYNSDDSDVTQTCIRKVSYKEGRLEAVGQTRINGTLNDSFSIDEYKGNLRLVTTVSSTGRSTSPVVLFGAAEDTAEKNSNALYILDEKLEELSRIDGLAKDETVYSARFMGDTGYFVTYKQVDPLFSVDLSDPKKPKILGELKIPGFSDYLHPYGDGLLLGIGMDVDETGTVTNGVKLSMFDISDPANVKEVEKYVMEDIYSSSVSYNYKAALISTDRNLIGFTAYGQGAHYFIFSYDSKEGFKCLFDREMGSSSEGRGVYSGDKIYIVSGNTVESFTIDGFQKVDDIVL